MLERATELREVNKLSLSFEFCEISATFLVIFFENSIELRSLFHLINAFKFIAIE